MNKCFFFPIHAINVPIEGNSVLVHCLFGALIPARSNTAANSNSTTNLFSADFLSILYISWGNSAVGSGVPNGFVPPEKFTASKYLAKVLILVTVAPVKSFPVVVWLTVNKIAVIVPRALLQ